MNITPFQAAVMILLAGSITFGLRALPFLVFGNRSELPPLLSKLAATLPAAIMAVLVVYCLKGLQTAPPNEWSATLIACATVTGLHLWRKNTLLSVFAGTAIYMILLQLQ